MSDEQKRKRFWTVLIAALVLWIAIPVVAVVVFTFARYLHERAMQKLVPNLIGLDTQSGEAKARAAGFLMEVTEKERNLPESPCTVGTITKQEPHPNKSIYIHEISVVSVVTCVGDPDK